MTLKHAQLLVSQGIGTPSPNGCQETTAHASNINSQSLRKKKKKGLLEELLPSCR